MAPPLRVRLQSAASFFKDSDFDLDLEDDGPPAMKKYRTVRSHFPKIMPAGDEGKPKIRYVPIDRDDSFPSTSFLTTKSQRLIPRDHSSPVCLKSGERWNKSDDESCSCYTPCVVHKHSGHVSKPLEENRMRRETYFKDARIVRRPVIYQVVNVDDDDDDDCQLVETVEPSKQRLSPEFHYIKDRQESSDSDHEVIPIEPISKKILDTSRKKDEFFEAPKSRTNKFFISRNLGDSYRRLVSRKSVGESFFKSTKAKGKLTMKNNTSIGTNWTRTKAFQGAIAASFRLDEKKNFEELINSTKLTFQPRSFYAKQLHKNLLDVNERTPVSTEISEYIDLTEGLNDKDESFTSSHFEKNFEKKSYFLDITEDDDQSDPNIKEVVTKQPIIQSTYQIKFENRLKMEMQNKPVLNPSWLENLNRRYNEISLQRESELEKLSKSDVAEIAVIELTDEQESKIDQILRPSRVDEVLIQKFNMNIHRRDLQTLVGLNWLNDEIINFYMNLIAERSQEKQNLPKSYGMNTFFYPKLEKDGYSGVRRWTRKVDIFSHDLILIPIHLGVHWCMAIASLKNETITYYDSMGGKNMDCCENILKYLDSERLDKKKQKLNTSSWKLDCVKDIPHQMNGSDCGMFSCMFAEYVSRGVSITFTQNDMPYFRRKMALEIVQGELLM